MKIIVSSKAEKELMQKFIEIINDCCCIEDIEEDDNDTSEVPVISHDEYRFIENGFNNCKVEVNESIQSMTQEHHIVGGTCQVCRQEISGMTDGEDITYDEYLEIMSEKMICEDCIKKCDKQ